MATSSSFFRPRHPEGTYYLRGLSAIAAGALLMAFSIASESTASGQPMSAVDTSVVLFMGILALLSACVAIFLTAYLKTTPAVLKIRYAHRQGSLTGWAGHRLVADAAAGTRARTGLGRLLVRIREGTWSGTGELSGPSRTHRNC